MTALNSGVEWALRNRAASAAIGILLCLLLVTQCGRGGGQAAIVEPTPTSMATSSTVTVPTSDQPTESLEESSEATTSTEAYEPAASLVALRFVQAWLSNPTPPGPWLAGLKPYAAPDLYAAFKKTPPSAAAIPDARTDGQPEVLVDGPALWRIRVSLTDDSAVQVEVISDGGDPMVSNIEMERE